MHRDVKSMNVLVSEDYACKLTDFGCAKLVSDREIYNTINSGTPLWMAPEVKRGQYHFSADVYSLGLVLYELFEKKLPDYDQMRQTISLPPSFQSASVVIPCLNVSPERRPTAHQVVAVLEKMISNIVKSVQKLLPQAEQDKIQTETQLLNQQDTSDMLENELLVLYRHLLSKSPREVDRLINEAFANHNPPPATPPPTVQQPIAQVPYGSPQISNYGRPPGAMPQSVLPTPAPQMRSMPIPISHMSQGGPIPMSQSGPIPMSNQGMPTPGYQQPYGARGYPQQPPVPISQPGGYQQQYNIPPSYPMTYPPAYQ